MYLTIWLYDCKLMEKKIKNKPGHKVASLHATTCHIFKGVFQALKEPNHHEKVPIYNSNYVIY